MIKKLSIFFFLVGISFTMKAQSLEVGGFGGVSYYNGDLNPGLPFQEIEPAYGFVARYSKSTRWAFRFNFITGKLSSNGDFARNDAVKNIAFTTTISDMSVLVEFNFFDYFTGSNKDYITPYVFGGVSTFGVNSNGFIESIGFNQFSFPFGVGLKYSLGKKLGLSAEWRIHKAFDDSLDQVESASISGKPILYDDPNTNDWYSFTGVAITYKFNLEKKQKCNSFDNYKYK